MNDAIKVFSAKSLSTMVAEGGSGHWKLSKTRAAKCRYLIVVRNMHAQWSEPGHAHSTAFLVGKVSGIKAVGDRFTIQFSEYADINIPDSWDGSRNPVSYTTLEKAGIECEKLKWQPYPGNISPETDSHGSKVSPLTIEQAKLGLAAAFAIRPDQIEINIKA